VARCGKDSVGPLLRSASQYCAAFRGTVRNYVEFHRFIPLRSNFPFELWLGNNNVFDDRSPDVNARVTRYEEERRYVQLGETAFMKEKWNLATDFIRTHKLLEVRLTVWRFMDFWVGSSHPLQAFENAESAWIRAIFAFNFLTAAGGIIGLANLWRTRSPYCLPVAAFIVTVPLVYYATHASLRYRHPIDPIVLTLNGNRSDRRETTGQRSCALLKLNLCPQTCV